MTNESLFINLIHRLGKYPEAVVLAVAMLTMRPDLRQPAGEVNT